MKPNRVKLKSSETILVSLMIVRVLRKVPIFGAPKECDDRLQSPNFICNTEG